MSDDDRIGTRTWEWNEIVRGLGLVCIEFQILETVLKANIASLIAKDDPLMGSIVTAELSFRGLIDLLYGLVEYEKEAVPEWKEIKKELKKLLGWCLEAEAKRNQLIHSSWYEPSAHTKATRIKITARNQRGLQVHREEVTPSNMIEIANELSACRKALVSYLRKILGER